MEAMNTKPEAEPRNQCGETCERAKLCAVCAKELAEPQDEPVAWGMRHSDGRIYDCIAPGEHDREPGQYTVPLYTTPQRQPLTDEAILAMVKTAPALDTAEAEWLQVARAIEKAHGIGGQDDTR